MKNVVLFLGVAAVTCMSAGATLAADPILPPPAEIYYPEETGVDWSGPYIGVHVGYGRGIVGWEAPEISARLFSPIEDDYENTYDIDGWLAGLQAGANAQFGNIVVGVEGDISWADISGASEDSFSEHSLEISWLATLRARLGLAYENFLVYGTAGIAFAGVDTGYYPGFGDDLFEDSTQTGIAVGLGAEAMVTDNLSIKAEYIYNYFGDYHAFEDDEVGPVTQAFDVSTFKVGLNLHF